MQREWMLIILIVIGGFSASTAYIFADTFTSLSITPGTATFTNDLIFDRTDNDNSIVQGSDAFTAGKGLVYQKVGGGAMTSYTVNALTIKFIGGSVGIGTSPNPAYTLDVNGVVKINNDLVFDRTDVDNSLVQSTGAFNAGHGIIFQKQGGGGMSSFSVYAQTMKLSSTGGDICIGSC